MHKVFIVLMLIISLPLSASPELWLGAAFMADRNYVSDEISDSFPAMGDEIAQIRSLGLDLDAVFFPSDIVRIGLIGGYNILLPIGRTLVGGDNEGYITYDFDYRQDLSIGLSYYQFFSDKIGAYVNCSFMYSWYRTALEHIPNDSEPMDYVKEQEYGILGEAGIVSKSGNMYFRLGVSGFYDLRHRLDHGFRLSLTAGGGFIIR